MTRTLLVLVFVHFSAQVSAELRFSCQGRPAGYYADVDSGCQIYHMCDGLGRQFSYTCPNTTLFQQRMLVCDHWYMVNCSRSEDDYSANLLIGQHRPFVDDSVEHPYRRTPRPDLLSQPTAAEYNIIYRRGRAQNIDPANVVGAEVVDRNNGPSYNLPSRWSTELSSIGPVTLPSVKKPPPVQAEIIDRANNVIQNKFGKAINFQSNSLNNIKPDRKQQTVNFVSSYKGTTPVFPTLNELGTTPAPPPVFNDLLQPPKSSGGFGPIRRIDNAPVNFKSNYKGTTPVFPTLRELGTTPKSINDLLQPPVQKINQISNKLPTGFNKNLTDNKFIQQPNQFIGQSNRQNVKVNFKSNYKGTTPVYPTLQELGTTPVSINDLLQPPLLRNGKISNRLGSDFDKNVQVNFKSNYNGTTPVYPTLQELGTTPAPIGDLLLPPAVSSDRDSALEENKFVVKTEAVDSKQLNNATKEKMLENIRQQFAIPDYEFPLEPNGRPGYGDAVDPVQSNPFLVNDKTRKLPI